MQVPPHVECIQAENQQRGFYMYSTDVRLLTRNRTRETDMNRLQFKSPGMQGKTDRWKKKKEEELKIRKNGAQRLPS